MICLLALIISAWPVQCEGGDEAICGWKPMKELASQFGLHPTRIARWKGQCDVKP